MLPINISIRILRPWNGTTHTLLPSRLVNPPVGGPIGRIDPFDMADPVGDAAKPRKTLPFDGVLEVAATRIVRAPQPPRLPASSCEAYFRASASSSRFAISSSDVPS